MPAEPGNAPNGFRKAVVTVAASVTSTLILVSIGTAVLVWSDQRMLSKDVEANRVLIMACCSEGGDTRSDLRNLTTRFDAFLNNLDKLLGLSERRLQRLEDEE